MAEIEKLNIKEKIFLAGCIQGMILADGVINDEEIADLNNIIIKHFNDFDQRLLEFEKTVKDQESFWEMAEAIKTPQIKDIILEVLYELSIQDGFANKVENHLINKLKEIWEK